MRRRTINWLVSLLTSLWLAGCVVTLPQPLTPVAKAKIDKALLGTWRDEEQTLTAVVEAQDGHGLNITVTELASDGQTRTSHYQGHTSILKGKHYLNLHGEESGEGYLLMRYSVKGDVTEMSLLDPGATRTAVRRGEIAGKADDSTYAPEVNLTADAAAIAAFIVKHQSELFKNPARLLRVTASSTK
ncbi:MAG TPA: hypothetical protein VMH34_10000 [Gammaproteobacteria bacterium]|nr:hypothetical protein [Gammaproteobacteria bacterium]